MAGGRSTTGHDRELGKVYSDRGEGDNEKIIVEKERGNKPS